MQTRNRRRNLSGKMPWSGILVLLGIAFSGCSHPPDLRPNVVIVLVDTLRSDHLSVAGYGAETSPFLDKLAEQGVFFERFFSHSAATRPSVATLLTSRFISGHGIATHGRDGLARELDYLPALLNDTGYRTLAFVTNPQVHEKLGFARGFDHFESLFASDLNPARVKPGDLVKLPAAEVFAVVERDLERHATAPFFAYIHLLDPHGPYRPPPGVAERFVDPTYHGEITGAIADFRKAVHFRSHPADLEHFKALYDAEIAATDQALAGFFDWIEKTGLLETTHLIITADHGEEFLEHGGTGHGRKLYDENIRVPLLWVGPGVPQGRRIDELAGLIDIVPTLADLLDLPLSPDAGFQGRSLRALWEGEPDPPWRQVLFLEGINIGKLNWRRKDQRKVTRGIVTKTHKVLARDCLISRPQCGMLEVVDLAADPGEQQRRRLTGEPSRWSEDDLALVELFRRETDSALRYRGPESVPAVDLPAEDRARLEMLGYLQPSAGDGSGEKSEPQAHTENPPAPRIFADSFETGTPARWSKKGSP